jgi:predicted cupin superfamily sugar epimerase
MLLPPLARHLDLRPHPEGGWFRETWRSPVTFTPAGYPGPRSAATAIYFLLHPGERSRWHVVRSDELWFWHSGGPLTLRMQGRQPSPDTGDDSAEVGVRPGTGFPPQGKGPGRPEPAGAIDVMLGPDILAGQQPQALVPGGVWQTAAPSADDPVLVSCVVAPGFDFADFSLA